MNGRKKCYGEAPRTLDQRAAMNAHMAALRRRRQLRPFYRGGHASAHAGERVGLKLSEGTSHRCALPAKASRFSAIAQCRKDYVMNPERKGNVDDWRQATVVVIILTNIPRVLTNASRRVSIGRMPEDVTGTDSFGFRRPFFFATRGLLCSLDSVVRGRTLL